MKSKKIPIGFTAENGETVYDVPAFPDFRRKQTTNKQQTLEQLGFKLFPGLFLVRVEYRTWENPVISMVCRPPTRGFIWMCPKDAYL